MPEQTVQEAAVPELQELAALWPELVAPAPRVLAGAKRGPDGEPTGATRFVVASPPPSPRPAAAVVSQEPQEPQGADAEHPGAEQIVEKAQQTVEAPSAGDEDEGEEGEIGRAHV